MKHFSLMIAGVWLLFPQYVRAAAFDSSSCQPFSGKFQVVDDCITNINSFDSAETKFSNLLPAALKSCQLGAPPAQNALQEMGTPWKEIKYTCYPAVSKALGNVENLISILKPKAKDPNSALGKCLISLSSACSDRIPRLLQAGTAMKPVCSNGH